MTRPSLALIMRRLPFAARLITVIGLVLLSGVLGAVFAGMQSGPAATAWWWPAAGVAVAAVVTADRRSRFWVLLGIAAVTAAASASAGRGPAFVVLGAIGAAFEVWIVATAVAPGDDEPRLSTLLDVGRFLAAAAVGALVVGGCLGLGAALSGGAFVPTLLSTSASHISAVVLITPLALLNRLRKRTASAQTVVLLSLALLAAVVAAFSPLNANPLAFLPVPILAWAAFSESMFVAFTQFVGTIVAVVALTAIGGGPFAHPAGGMSTGTLLQIYSFALAATTLGIGATRNERRLLQDQTEGLLRLLRDAFERANNGFAILQEVEGGRYAVIEINAVASTILRSSFAQLQKHDWIVVPRSPLHRQLASLGADEARVLDWELVESDSIPATVSIESLSRSGYGRVYLISVVDLRPLRDAEAAIERRLQRERQVVDTLRALNREKDDFVASVSHELRTPVTSIIGFTEELADLITDPVQRDFVLIVHRNAERLLDVVENILALSKERRAAERESDSVAVDLEQLLRECISDLTINLRGQKATISADLTPGIVVHGRPGDLARLFLNLLTNAVKFSPPGGLVEVSAQRSSGQVTVQIRDQGPGIDEVDLPRVFDRFYRSSSATAAGVSGTGLGLAIVQELAAELGATVALTRGHDDVGTVATVSLPALDPVRHAEPVGPTSAEGA
ncbi:MAG: hypothetical protein CMH36_04420 [Microbacterium sp.]|uniref:histidine kinase n=2 Tax=Microbacterium ginsengisoli TaxID=400772 RepID=A0A0F0LQ62_9MICO|nr:HAMP domain-containing sensor histidine kinase [Microbacterium ginsengisoli]KJL34824.1 Alkaline phosphatase synthesis sensor protein PhoR [Microbacterium ginsengisoli]KJL35091.1 Alkaline phosphatase synthesis sensor protein PhoR [Microbacterium ginsengisoli]MAL06067.1 hypothetical protein [Microbacterium sp.]